MKLVRCALLFLGLLAFSSCATVKSNVPRSEYIDNLVTAHNLGCTSGLWEKANYCGRSDAKCQSEIKTRCDRLNAAWKHYLETEVFKDEHANSSKR